MLAVALLTTALFGLCPESRQEVNQWGFPEWSEFCGDRKWSDCIVAIEKSLMDRAGGAVYRRDDALHFRIDGRDELVLRDDRTDRNNSTSYRYWGESGSYHLVLILFYEAGWYGVVSKETGSFTKVIRGGLPVLSPDERWMASASSGAYAQRGTTVDVWSLAQDPIERIDDFRFQANEFGVPLLRWNADQRVDLCWLGQKSSHLGRVELKDGEWVSVPAGK